jgi:hypothetical protein
MMKPEITKKMSTPTPPTEKTGIRLTPMWYLRSPWMCASATAQAAIARRI